MPGAEVLRQPGGGPLQEYGEGAPDLGRHCGDPPVLCRPLDGLYPAGEDLWGHKTSAEALRASPGKDARLAGDRCQLLDAGKDRIVADPEHFDPELDPTSLPNTK